MKNYIKPSFEFVSLRLEEIFAAGSISEFYSSSDVISPSKPESIVITGSQLSDNVKIIIP